MKRSEYLISQIMAQEILFDLAQPSLIRELFDPDFDPKPYAVEMEAINAKLKELIKEYEELNE